MSARDVDEGVPDFVILTEGRTGSQFLVTLLDSHPDVRCAGEILGCVPLAPGDAEKEIAIALDRIRSARRGGVETRFGFKLPWGCLVPDRSLLVHLLRRGSRCIVQFRRNKLAMYLSMRLAQINGDFSSSRPYAQQSLEIDPEHLLTTIAAFERHEREMLEITRGWPRTLASYEAMQADPDVPWVQDFLGVPLRPLRATTTRARSGHQRSTIRNYDRIAAVLRDGPYAGFLEEVGAPSAATG